jgi:hypothetical protein
MIEGSCHCGAVRWTYALEPGHVTNCNCSICRRIAARWAYGDATTITVTAPESGLIRYIQGDRTLAIVSCATCGCTTHWEALAPSEGRLRMAVNMRMADPMVLAAIPIKDFDGADTWTRLPPGHERAYR